MTHVLSARPYFLLPIFPVALFSVALCFYRCCCRGSEGHGPHEAEKKFYPNGKYVLKILLLNGQSMGDIYLCVPQPKCWGTCPPYNRRTWLHDDTCVEQASCWQGRSWCCVRKDNVVTRDSQNLISPSTRGVVLKKRKRGTPETRV